MAQDELKDLVDELAQIDAKASEGAMVLANGRMVTKAQADELFLQYFALEQQTEMFKSELEKAMVLNGMTKWETDDYVVTLIENKPSKVLDKDAIAATLEKYLGETIDNYYRMSKPKKKWKLSLREKK